MITLEQAKRQQNELQAEGRELLKRLDVERQLARLGKVRVEGSFIYGLMVKPDIDIEVIVDEVRLDDIAELAKELILGSVESVRVVTRHWPNSKHSGFPNGVYMGLQHHVGIRRWNFDIWFHKLADRVDPKTFGPGWHENLTQEQRDIILLLKYQLEESGDYPFNSNRPRSFGSADVYRAVMQDGVRTVERLREWRKTNPHR